MSWWPSFMRLPWVIAWLDACSGHVWGTMSWYETDAKSQIRGQFYDEGHHDNFVGGVLSSWLMTHKLLWVILCGLPEKKGQNSYIITCIIQSNLVISNLLISNYRLSRSENLVPVLTWNYNNRQQNNVEKRRNCSSGTISPLFHIILYMYF